VNSHWDDWDLGKNRTGLGTGPAALAGAISIGGVAGLYCTIPHVALYPVCTLMPVYEIKHIDIPNAGHGWVFYRYHLSCNVMTSHTASGKLCGGTSMYNVLC